MKLKIAFALIFPVFISGCSFAFPFPAFRVEPSKPGLYRGVYHVHSEHSHDSHAKLDHIIQSAEHAQLDFVIITDHNNMNGRAHYAAMNPSDRPLLIFGTELSTHHYGHIVALGTREMPLKVEEIQRQIDATRAAGGYMVVAHPLLFKKPWPKWDIERYEGIEVFSFSDIAYSLAIDRILLKGILYPPGPFLNSVIETPTGALKLWDEKLLEGRRVSAFGSIDAHIRYKRLGITIENFRLYFQAVTMYVEADELAEAKIVDALRHGRSFIAFEVRGVAQNFSFFASVGDKRHTAGDVIRADEPVTFHVNVPKPAELVLIYNGEVVNRTEGKTLAHTATASGYYRAEVYRNGKIWIISNPIYVE